RGLAGCFVLPGQGSLAALCGGVGSWRASGFAGVARLVSGGGRMKPRISLRKALSDKQLLADALPDESWAAWRILLTAALGEPLKPDELDRFKQLTGRDTAPTERVQELVAVVGRRGGKSRAIATLAAYLATLCDYRDKLASGERGVVLCLAPS